MPFIKLTKPERRKIVVVLTCFLLAVLAWFFMALNGRYKYTAKTVMAYSNFPANRAFHPLQSDTIQLQVEGSGWQLIMARLRVSPNYVNVDLRKLRNQEYIVLTEQLSAMNRQLETSQKVISANPDTLYFDFSRASEKRVPVKLTSAISFKKQYGFSEKVTLLPEYVTVRGPKEALDTIRHWSTDTLKLTGLSQSASMRIPLRKNKMKNVTVFPSNVEANLTVEEFTEKTLELPLKIYHNNAFLDVALYPRKVSVTFLVALSAYKDVDERFIEVGVDLKDWQQKGYDQLWVKLKRFPDYCKLVKIHPAVVDFIIEK